MLHVGYGKECIHMGKTSSRDLSGYFSLSGPGDMPVDKRKADDENWKGLWGELRRRFLVCSTCSSESIRVLIFHQEM
jgi:hypothetical protein